MSKHCKNAYSIYIDTTLKPGSKMRLTPEQIAVIKAATAEYFGSDAAVLLFGSRTDDEKRGGDIDLYIECLLPLQDGAVKSSRMNAALQMKLGAQKIDIVVWSPGQKRLPIHDEAKRTGIRL